MTGRNWMAEELARVRRRLAEVERRQENTMRHGAVEEVDTEKQMVRLKIGKGPDGKDQLSPWVPYAQQAGALKIHTPPSKGQNMTVLAPGGDLEQSVAMPFSWNNGNPSPSTSADENMLTFGSVKITVTGDAVIFTVGGHSVTLSSAGTKFEGGAVGHDGHDIGATHRHGGVQPGGAQTDVPIGGGP